MSNDRYNDQMNDPEPQATGTGQKPLPAGPKNYDMPMRTANWPGLPGKPGPDRSAGVPEEKVYAFAQGLRGGKEVNDGDA